MGKMNQDLKLALGWLLVLTLLATLALWLGPKAHRLNPNHAITWRY